jgi:hypothetical protein
MSKGADRIRPAIVTKGYARTCSEPMNSVRSFRVTPGILLARVSRNGVGLRRIVIALVLLVSVTLPATSQAASTKASAKTTFTSGVMPHPTKRPSAEPGMAIDGGGTIWVSSFMAGGPPAPEQIPNSFGELQGTGIWKSTDGGASYRWVIDPFKPVANLPGVPLAGNDSDIAAAPLKNADGFYNVYAVALYPSNMSIILSRDGGATWIPIPLAGITGFPFDRPWATADGACLLYVTYHSGPEWFINRYDFCDPTNSNVAVDPVSRIDVPPGAGLTGASALIGKIVADTSKTSRFAHRLYMPMEVCVGPSPVGEGDGDNPVAEILGEDLGSEAEAQAEEDGRCDPHPYISVAVSSDRGATWTEHRVATLPTDPILIWPATVATDADGTVYVAWFDESDAFIARSENGGASWSAPSRINTGAAKTAVYPTVAATGKHTVGVAYYGTERDGNANDAKVMGAPNATGSAPWAVWYAFSRDDGRTFTNTAATGVIHLGQVCTRGGACAVENSRNLFDDFGMVFNTRGKAAIAHTTDRVPIPGKTIGTLDTTFTAYATQR